MTEELTSIAKEMAKFPALYVDGRGFGWILPTEHAAKFKAIAIEAKSIIDDHLKHANDYSLALMKIISAASTNHPGDPTSSSIEEAVEIVYAAARAIQRKLSAQPVTPNSSRFYVDPGRIIALQGLSSGEWDFKRLVELCRELNVAAANRCHMATAMLLRTMLNHVPPILGHNTFAEVANNYGTPKTLKSFKASMQRLEGSLRNIADMHLHSPIRAVEDVPSGVQVDFAADLDVLLGEVIRVSGVPG